MAKTCRTCRCLVVLTRCPWLDIHPAHVDAHQSYGCYKPRETPLLVDELAEALRRVWDGGFADGDEEREVVEAVLVRYQKEVGDGEG